MVIRRGRGRELVRWELRQDKMRNEPLDCRVYAMGAYEILNPDLKRYVAGIGNQQYNMPIHNRHHTQQSTISSTHYAPAGRKKFTFRRGFSV